MTEGKIPLAGVIGCPIAHSRSPDLHGFWLREYGIRGFYVPMDVASAELEGVLRMLPKMGFRGVNITLPHKETAIAVADKVTDRASLIGAANTLTFAEDGSILADNTDGYGFISNLRTGCPHWNPTSGPALVIGAGGAARAVMASLLDAGVPEIWLTNRTRVRAEVLKQAMGKKITVIEWARFDEKLAEAALLVNTSSLGMQGQSEMPFTLNSLRPETVVTDIVYTPLETKLLTIARTRGCATVDGLGMLLHQAAPGFERWFGQKPEVTDALRAHILG